MPKEIGNRFEDINPNDLDPYTREKSRLGRDLTGEELNSLLTPRGHSRKNIIDWFVNSRVGGCLGMGGLIVGFGVAAGVLAVRDGVVNVGRAITRLTKVDRIEL